MRAFFALLLVYATIWCAVILFLWLQVGREPSEAGHQQESSQEQHEQGTPEGPHPAVESQAELDRPRPEEPED